MFKKPLKAITNLTLLSATTYLTYKKLSKLAFNEAFCKKQIPFELENKYTEWLNSSKKTDVYINSYDGLKLHGLKIENNNTNNYVIIVHGIYCNLTWSIPNAYEFDKLGYNLLVLDQRCCGESEGQYFTYGFKESFDLIKWSEYLISENKDINIIYYGISMGAATVMMSSNNKLPSNVKCIVEDCGFSNLKDEIGNVVSQRYHILKPNPLLKLLEQEMIDKIGIRFDDVKPGDALINNEIPLMIIHGEQDSLVPFKMSKYIYNKQKGYKKYFAVKDAKHAEAMKHKNYYQHIDEFIKKFV